MTNRYDNLRELYQAARPNEEPTKADQRAVRTAMMSAGIAAVTFHTSSAAGKLLALAPGGAKLFTLGQVVTYTAIGVAIGGGIAVTGFAALRNAAPISADSSSSSVHATPLKHRQVAAPALQLPQLQVTAQVDLPPQPSVVALPPAAPVRSNQEPRTAPVAAIAPPASPSPSAPGRAAEPQAQSLRDESRGLAEVQFALGAGNVNRALRLLDQQDQAFSGGTLTQERAAARVIALCTANYSGASMAKERFINAYPGSPLVHRVNATCKNR